MSGHLTELVDRFHQALGDRMDTAEYWLRNVGRPYPPLSEVRRTALNELRRNPTITTYKFRDGNEIRRPGDPRKRFQQLYDGMVQALKSIGLFE